MKAVIYEKLKLIRADLQSQEEKISEIANQLAEVAPTAQSATEAATEVLKHLRCVARHDQLSHFIQKPKSALMVIERNAALVEEIPSIEDSGNPAAEGRQVL